MEKPETVFPTAAEFNCRSCGAHHIPASGHFNLCAACWDRFVRYAKMTGGGRPSHPDKKPRKLNAREVNEFLARNLFLDAMRMKRYGVVGRCEAISATHRGWLKGRGEQCRLHATVKRNGRRVCALHADALNPKFVGSLPQDPYTDLQRILTDLARVDLRFRECLAASLSSFRVTGT